MSVYVVIATGAPLDSEVARVFDDQSRSQAAEGVWFVKSSRLSSSDVVKDLGIGMETKSGIVVSAQYYDGVGPSDLVEKLVRWRNES